MTESSETELEIFESLAFSLEFVAAAILCGARDANDGVQ